MKNTIAALLLLLACGASASLISQINGNVRLRWNYVDEPAGTNHAFNIYFTTDLAAPAGQWPLLTNILSTAALDTNSAGGTNYFVDVTLPPGRYFFTSTITNFWGESSVTSNIVSTPPAPRPMNTLKIEKLL